MTKRAVLYARVSRDDRSNDGRNLLGQLEMGRKYAQEHGYTIVAEMAEDDRGASGAEIDLPQLNRVREMADADEFDVLVVREIDRLSCNLAKQLIVEQELKRSGASIEYVIGEYPDTPEGRLNKHIKATIAEYEREKIAERTARARRQKVGDGHVMVHGRSPYGYKIAEVDGKRTLVVHEPEARIVRLIFQWYTVGNEDSGPMSIYAIANRLTAQGIPTRGDTSIIVHKRSPRGKWSKGVVSQILHNETYVGKWHYGKQRRVGGKLMNTPRSTWLSLDVEPIIDREIWQRAQAQLSKNKNAARRNTKYEYLMRRRVFCGQCGTPMRAKTQMLKSGSLGHYRCPVAPGTLDYVETCTMNTHFRVDMLMEWCGNGCADCLPIQRRPSGCCGKSKQLWRRPASPCVTDWRS